MGEVCEVCGLVIFYIFLASPKLEFYTIDRGILETPSSHSKGDFFEDAKIF